MTENMKSWLADLYEKEIKETQANINNMKIWLCGSPTEEEQFEYTTYIAELEEYITELKNLVNQLEEN